MADRGKPCGIMAPLLPENDAQGFQSGAFVRGGGGEISMIGGRARTGCKNEFRAKSL